MSIGYLLHSVTHSFGTTCSRAVSTTSRTRSRVFRVEVERKFHPTSKLKLCLQANGMIQKSEQLRTPHPFLSLVRRPDELIRDTYYDFNDQLKNKGIWIRSRTSAISPEGYDAAALEEPSANTEFEAKVKIGGDYANSQFQEVEGKSNIRLLVDEHIPGIRMEELEIMADLLTYRKSWIIQWLNDCSEDHVCEATSQVMEISLVLDKVVETGVSGFQVGAFTHCVGEVEMTRDVVEEVVRGSQESARRKEMNHMDSSIEKFMNRHMDLFPTFPKPKGKLSAYFEWKNDKTSP